MARTHEILRDQKSLDAWSDDFLYRRAGIPAVNASLFPHHRYLEQTVLERLLRVGCRVQLRDLDETGPSRKRKRKAGKVELVCQDIVLVAFDDDTDGKTEFVDFAQLELVTKVDGEIDKELSELGRELNENRSIWKSILLETIRIGDVFELRDAKSLQLSVVEIVSTRNGFVKVKRKDNSTEFVHITSSSCHPIGWTKQQIEHGISYAPVEGSIDGRVACPAWLFDYAPLEKHDFMVGSLIEVLDITNRMTFRPAVVTEVLNQHYFNVRLLCDLTEDANWENLTCIPLCHRNATDIRPLGWCSKNNVRLSYPIGASNYAEVKELTKRKIAPAVNLDTTRSTFSNIGPSVVDEKLETVRYCEFMSQPLLPSGEEPIFVPAAIVCQFKNIVCLKMENTDKCQPPQLHAVTSSRLFPWGFAKKSGFGLTTTSTLPSVLKFDLSPAFTNQRSNVFRENRKRFMINSWLKPGIWLPTIYFNKNCFAGPFMIPTAIRSMPPFFGPGALPILLVEIIKRMAQCSIRMTRFVELVEAKKNTLLPTVHINIIRNIRSGAKNFSFNVEACENTEQFCGWLRMFLLRLDACPNLLSAEQKCDTCPYGCEAMAALPYIQSQLITTSVLLTPPEPDAAKLLVDRKRVLRNNRLNSEGKSLEGSRDGQGPSSTTVARREKRISLRRFSPTTSGATANRPPMKARRPFGSSDAPDNHNALNGNGQMENGNNNGVSSLCIRRSSVSLDDMVNGRHTLDSNGNGLAMEPIISGPPPPKICHQTATTAGKLMMRVHDAVDDNAASSGSVLSAFILPQIGGGKINGNVGIQLIHNTPERLSSSPSNSNNATLFLTTSMSPPTSNVRIKYCCPTIDSNPVQWSCQKLAAWIQSADSNFGKIAQKFLEEEVDGEAVMMFSLHTLINLGMKVGPAVKVYALIEELKKEAVKRMGSQ